MIRLREVDVYYLPLHIFHDYWPKIFPEIWGLRAKWISEIKLTLK